MTTALSATSTPAIAAPPSGIRFKGLGRGRYEARLGNYLFEVEPVGVTPRGGNISVGKVMRHNKVVAQSTQMRTASAAKAWLQHWQHINLPQPRATLRRSA